MILNNVLNKFKKILINHRIAIILAIFASIIVSFPQFYLRYDKNIVNQGIELIPDSPWSARVREVQDGHPNFGAIYYKDGKDNPYVFQPLGSMVVAYMGKAFSLNINDTILFSRLVLSFITFILIYTFVLLISKSRLSALSSTVLILFANSIIGYSGILYLLQGLNPDHFLALSRPVNPAMVYIFLFAFLVAFWMYYRERKWQWGVASAIVLGLNFYNYFYTWTYLYAFGGILVLCFLFQKKWRDIMQISAVYIGGLIVAIPCLLNLYQATQNPEYIDASRRAGIVMSHTPYFVGTLVIISLLIYLWKFPREDKEKYFFGLALLFAPFITMNQQLLTGKVLQEMHYHWFFHKPIAVIFITIIIYHLLTKWKLDLYKKLLTIFIIVGGIILATFIQINSYKYDSRDGLNVAIERQRYAPLIDWLNSNAQKESVVLANDEISHLIVIYTPLNVFNHRAAGYSLAASTKRLSEVLYTFYHLRGLEAKNVDKTFLTERDYISSIIYDIYYRELCGSYECIPDDVVKRHVDEYKATLSQSSVGWLKSIFNKYEVEYLVWNKKDKPTWQLNKYSFLQKAADFGDLIIYKII